MTKILDTAGEEALNHIYRILKNKPSSALKKSARGYFSSGNSALLAGLEPVTAKAIQQARPVLLRLGSGDRDLVSEDIVMSTNASGFFSNLIGKAYRAVARPVINKVVPKAVRQAVAPLTKPLVEIGKKAIDDAENQAIDQGLERLSEAGPYGFLAREGVRLTTGRGVKHTGIMRPPRVAHARGKGRVPPINTQLRSAEQATGSKPAYPIPMQ